jgi:DNA mismatch repair protein MSH6
MCANVLTPRAVAKSSWKYINTKPESKDKYLIELPVTVNVPGDLVVKGKRGKGTKHVNKYRTSVVEDLVHELEHALDVQKDRKALGMRLIFAKFDSMRNLWGAAAQATALLDALGALAKASTNAGYTRATILDCPPDASSSITVVQGRHPCVERTLGSGEFVPNDLSLGTDNGDGTQSRVLLLSGVNMGGKSTCLRQTCLLAIMAQIVCFVPAEFCSLTPVDRIYTRLGESDRILMSQSTLFVEVRVAYFCVGNK